MREIKFRAWDEELKKWFNPRIENGVAVVEERHEEGCKHCGGTIFGSHTIEYPRPYKLVEYTAVQDKNGKEACEGDIVERVYEIRGKSREMKTINQIIFKDGTFKFYSEYQGGCGYTDIYGGHKVYPWEIIGNIHENPELIKVKS